MVLCKKCPHLVHSILWIDIFETAEFRALSCTPLFPQVQGRARIPAEQDLP